MRFLIHAAVRLGQAFLHAVAIENGPRDINTEIVTEMVPARAVDLSIGPFCAEFRCERFRDDDVFRKNENLTGSCRFGSGGSAVRAGSVRAGSRFVSVRAGSVRGGSVLAVPVRFVATLYEQKNKDLSG